MDQQLTSDQINGMAASLESVGFSADAARRAVNSLIRESNDFKQLLEKYNQLLNQIQTKNGQITSELYKLVDLNREQARLASTNLDTVESAIRSRLNELILQKERNIAEQDLLKIQAQQSISADEKRRIQQLIANLSSIEANYSKQELEYERQLQSIRLAKNKVDWQALTVSEKILKSKQQAAQFAKEQYYYDALIAQTADSTQKAYLLAKKNQAAAEFYGDSTISDLTKNLASGDELQKKLSEMVATTGLSILKAINAENLLGINENAGWLEKMCTLIEDGKTILVGLSDVLSKDVVTAVGTINTHMGKVNAALYGNTENRSFSSILQAVNENIGNTPYMSYKDLVENIAAFVERGITYNSEQRAFWYTLLSDLVLGFDALDSNLNRLIKLQQADMTEQGIGTASKLTALLNSQFNDTSYMSDSTGLYNTVYASIVDAMSTMDTDQASQFNFNLQKWLAGLYAVGLSDSSVMAIAQAYNQLATGNISSLSGTQAGKLLAMTTANGQKSYAEYLVNGMTGSDVNDLMKQMIEYLQSIANNTDNNVLKSEWGNILNLSMSDWKAISNLTNNDISSLANYTATQETLLEESSNLIQTVYAADRIHLSTKIENALGNASYIYGMGIANNETAYGLYRFGQLMNSLSNATGSSFLALLSGLSSLGTITAGAANLIRGVSSTMENNLGLTGFHNSDLFSWTVNRGGNTTAASTSLNSSTLSESLSLYNWSGSSSSSLIDEDEYEDVETSSADAQITNFLASEKSVSATAENIVNGESTVSRDINQLYAELFENQTTSIRVRLAEFEDTALLELAETLSPLTTSGQTNTTSNTFEMLRAIRGASLVQ